MGLRQTGIWQKLARQRGFRHFTLNLGIFCAIMSLCVFSNGFDLIGYSNIQAMNGFQQQFGNVCNGETGKCSLDSSHLSMFNSIPLIGFGAGVPFAAWLGEKYGRRVVFVVLNVVCVIGVGVTYSSKTYAQVLVGRCLVQAYVGMENNLIPMYESEIVPAKIRGAIVGNYFTFKLIGGIIIAVVCNKTQHLAGNLCWKTPVEIMFVVPCLCLLLAYFIPESPRWLLRKDDQDGALRVLQYINDGNENADINLELLYLKQSLDNEKEQGTWADLFRGTNTPRTMIAILSNFFGFASGQQFANIYATIFLKENIPTINPFLFSIYGQVTSVVGALVFMFSVDRFGRRFLWLSSAPMGATAMLVMGALGCVRNPSNAVSTGIAAMFPVFNFFFVSSFGLLPAVIIAEISSLRLRDKTAMVGWSTQNITNFVFAFTLPYLAGPSTPSADLGAKVAFIYSALGWVGVIWAYFFVPELQDRSLEEIDEMLRLKVPARKTKAWRPSADSIAGRLTRLEDNGGAGEKETCHVEEIEQA